ncbi:MAG: response regulator [Myxococcota bacterium]
MSESNRPRIMIVDDEEAILETMTFTFKDQYEVLTTADPLAAMSILEENQPVSVVITDQRMPGMTGVELLKEVYARFPETVRIILTGFADSDTTIKAINDGHIYGYINKPWEPDELKTMVRRASELHGLSVLNGRLLDDLQNANLFLAAVMDQLRMGAIAIDRDGIVRAVNKPAIAFIGLTEDVRGQSLSDVLSRQDFAELVEAVHRLAGEPSGSFEEVDLRAGDGHRVRISNQALIDDVGELIGRVILVKEISHEPLTRYFEEIVGRVSAATGTLRPELENAQSSLAALGERISIGSLESANMSELAERVSRTRTAIGNWLDVDDALAGDEYPDAQLLRDRLNVASRRWPRSEPRPAQVVELTRAVEEYYETGEYSRVRVL